MRNKLAGIRRYFKLLSGSALKDDRAAYDLAAKASKDAYERMRNLGSPWVMSPKFRGLADKHHAAQEVTDAYLNAVFSGIKMPPPTQREQVRTDKAERAVEKYVDKMYSRKDKYVAKYRKKADTAWEAAFRTHSSQDTARGLTGLAAAAGVVGAGVLAHKALARKTTVQKLVAAFKENRNAIAGIGTAGAGLAGYAGLAKQKD